MKLEPKEKDKNLKNLKKKFSWLIFNIPYEVLPKKKKKIPCEAYGLYYGDILVGGLGTPLLFVA